jgi:hypothetical protein
MTYKELIEEMNKMAEGLKRSQVIKLADEIELDDTVLTYLERIACKIKEDAFQNRQRYTEIVVCFQHEGDFDDDRIKGVLDKAGYRVVSYGSGPEGG